MSLLPVDKPIGIFDSGIGGLTIAHAIIEALPNERVIYFGDTAHLPYGDKSAELIQQFSTGISEFLLEKQSKLVIIACNTASSVAYESLVEQFGAKAHFVNVVDPIVRGIEKRPELKRVGIIGTLGTINSGVYTQKLKAVRPDLEVVSLATPLLAPMIEHGFFNNQISQAIISSYLEEDCFRDIDAMILACTHYPLIKKDIERFYGGKVAVIDSTEYIATEVEQILQDEGWLSEQRGAERDHFYVSDITESFAKTTEIFFQEKVELEFFPLWDGL